MTNILENPVTPSNLMEKLDFWGLPYELHHHKPLFTVAETKAANLDIPGAHCRNLFLRDNKKNNYLVVLQDKTELDLKKLPELIDSKRLSFGSPDRLWEFLKVKPGSVTPFAAINDSAQKVSVFLEKDMMAQDKINFHPLDNSMTLTITPETLRAFFKKINRDDITEVDLDAARPI